MNYCCYALIDTKEFNIFYIGKTATERLARRKSEHICESKNKKDYKSNKIKKILREEYDFHIAPIKFYNTEEEAYQDEENMIQLYKERGYKLCNSARGGEGVRNPSVETRKKLAKNASERFSGLGNPSKMPHVKKLRSEFLKKNNPMKNPEIKERTIQKIKDSCAKKVVQYSLSGELLNSFGGIREASRILNIGREGISRCCHGKLKSSGGFIWKFVNDFEELGG